MWTYRALIHTGVQLEKWLLPSYCTLCHVKSHGHGLCTACFDELPWMLSACKQCGNPFHVSEISAFLPHWYCGQCLQYPPMYDNTCAIFSYDFPVNRLLNQLKFQHKLEYAVLLGKLMAEKLLFYYHNQVLPQYILPVPLHSERLKVRGYNQAMELARPIAKRLRLPVLFNEARRVVATEQQSAGLSVSQRRKNLKKAFEIHLNQSVEHIAIIDDVVTTGSTVNELAITLKKIGVKKIDVWCCARTVLKK